MLSYPQYMSAKRFIEYRRKQKQAFRRRRNQIYKKIKGVENNYGSLLSKEKFSKKQQQ